MLRILLLMAMIAWTQLCEAADHAQESYFIIDNKHESYIKSSYINSLDSVTFDSDLTKMCGSALIIFPGDVDTIRKKDINCAKKIILIGVDDDSLSNIKHKDITYFLPERDIVTENISFAKDIFNSTVKRGAIVQQNNKDCHVCNMKRISTNEHDLVSDTYTAYNKGSFDFIVVPHNSRIVTAMNIRSFLITLSRLNIPVIGGSDERYIKSGFIAGAYIDHDYIINTLGSPKGLKIKKHKVPFVYIINAFVSKRFRVDIKEYQGQEVVLQ